MAAEDPILTLLNEVADEKGVTLSGLRPPPRRIEIHKAGQRIIKPIQIFL